MLTDARPLCLWASRMMSSLSHHFFAQFQFLKPETNFRFLNVPAKYLEDEWAAHLVDILTYHVTAGNVPRSSLSLGMIVDMVNMETANITSLSPPMINQATITAPDVAATNGVVHVVDSVLLPASATNSIVDIATTNEDFSTLASLLVAADLVGTLSGEGPFTVFAPTNAGELVTFACIFSVTSSFSLDVCSTNSVFPCVQPNSLRSTRRRDCGFLDEPRRLGRLDQHPDLPCCTRNCFERQAREW